MLALVSIYVKRLAVFMIFNSFIGILMPNNSYRGYVNLTMGIILMLIMVQPIGSLISSTENMVFAKEYELQREITEREINMYSDKQRELIISQFKTGLNKQVTELIKGYGEVTDVGFEISDNGENIEIKGINIEMAAKNDENQTIMNVKKLLSDFYNLEESNINITILEIRS